MNLACTVEFTFARLNSDFTWRPRTIVKTIYSYPLRVKYEEQRNKMVDCLKEEGEVIFSIKILPKEGEEFWDAGNVARKSYRLKKDIAIPVTKTHFTDEDIDDYDEITTIESYKSGTDIAGFFEYSIFHEPILSEDGKNYLYYRDYHDDTYHAHYRALIPVECVEEYFLD